MSSYSELTTLIDAYINRNGVQAITGQILNGVLRAMVDQLGRGFQIMGVAHPTDDPGLPDGPEAWYAGDSGTYTNFGGLTVAPGEIALLSFDNGWTKQVMFEGFDSVTATVDANIGTPSVQANYLNGVLSFAFHNLKGEQGIRGPVGVDSVVVTVDNTSGAPACAVSLVGQVLHLDFTGLKGAQGNPGSSLDYPFTLVNNLTTNDPDQALTAAMGYQLEGEITQLAFEVDGGTVYETPVDLSSLEKKYFTIDTNGKWQTSSQYYGGFIEVTPGQKMRVTKFTNGGYFAALKSATQSANTVPDYATGYSDRVAVADMEITLPDDANYVYCLIKNSNGVVDTTYELGDFVNGLSQDVTELKTKTPSIDKNDLYIGGTKVIDGIGFNSALPGNDNNLKAVYLQLVRGQAYRLKVVNPNWARTTASTGQILILRARKNDAWQTAVIKVDVGGTVANYYDFTYPEECDYMQLGIRADVGEFVYFTINEIEIEPTPSYVASTLRNVHIALMNKYAERYGAVLSTFCAPNGNSKICAKDMVLICLAAIENNTIASFWGKKVIYAPVFGNNPRLDTYESTYTDEVSHPKVADLSTYYHIFGGKTGSGGTPSQGRNLVVAAKSKVDDAWLIGCVLYSTNDDPGDNRFSVMKELFDLLELHRTGATVDASSLSCQGAYAIVMPNEGNMQNYGDYPFVSVGKNETGIIDSHSIVKLLTGLVATDWIQPFEMLTFTSDDPYSGSSGNAYSDGDQLYAINAIESMILTSSSVAARCIARYVGLKVLEKNGNKSLRSFRLLGRTAYSVGTRTWLQWLDMPEYLVWSAETGITLSCSGESSPVSISSGGSITGVTGGDEINANAEYS